MARSSQVPSSSRLVRRSASAAPRVARARSCAQAAGGSARPSTEGERARGASGRAGFAGFEGFAEACLPHQRELYALGLRLTGAPDQAVDLVQDTLLRALTAWDRFEAGTNVRAWLCCILTNAFITGYRKRRRHDRLGSAWPGDVLRGLYGGPEDHVAPAPLAARRDELGAEVRAALDRLGPEARDVVERADLRGERYRDIAAALGVPVGTVMSRLFRARRTLELELAEVAARDWGIRRAA